MLIDRNNTEYNSKEFDMEELAKKYNFSDVEKKHLTLWQKDKIYSYSPNIPRENTYIVDTPPPSISGTLHMGHVFSYTQTDFIVRFQRMRGKNVFYPMGFDDNGLPTERLVEKKNKVRSHNLSREEFIKMCQMTVNAEESLCRNLFNNLALSIDWSLEYQTISNNSRAISQMSFLDLREKNQIYRESQAVLWDPVDGTALSQADIEDKEQDSCMNEIQFHLEDGKAILIATTRPELLPACAAILFHPEDKRYKDLVGQSAIAPLFNIKIPLIHDINVDIEKGTGLVMCCTYGDNMDITWKKIYHLPERVMIDKKGKICIAHNFDERCLDQQKAKEFYDQIAGMYVKDARKKIIEILAQNNFLVSSQPITNTVKCAERSGAPLEIMTAPQWFVKVLDHKEALLKQSAALVWHPKSMKIKLDQWINSLSWDWCISRQRYFGVPFPVWYSKRRGETGKPIFASKKQLPVDPLVDLPEGYSREEVEPDRDVMDTWATSSVSPNLNSWGISDKYYLDPAKHKQLFPADLRPQGHEIIRTWAYYTMLKSYLHENCLPWKNIMISGWCLAKDKSKMSKSKGNIVDPMKLLDIYGADVVRYWASTSRLGTDTAYCEEVLKNGKRIINKLWNSAKFVSMHITDIKSPDAIEELIQSKEIFYQTDLWILSKLQSTIDNVTTSLENYEYALGREYLEQFFWNAFCDNYVEIIKSRIYDRNNLNPQGKKSAQYTLYYVLHILLKAFAPYIPHITEEIYGTLYSDSSVHEKGNWPQIKIAISAEDITQVEKALLILDHVRKVKAQHNLSIKAEIELMEYRFADNVILNHNMIEDLQHVTNTLNILHNNSLDDNPTLNGGLYVKLKFN